MPELKQGEPLEMIEISTDDETYLCLINFQNGVGSWSRDTNPNKAIKRCSGIVKEDFNLTKKDYPITAIVWRVKDTNLYWEAEAVPKWEGHEDKTATWWKIEIQHSGLYAIDEDYRVRG